MKTTWLFPTFSVIALGLLISPMARSAELQVLAGGAMTVPLRELATEFERTAGHKLLFGTTPELINLATSGDAFDLGVIPREVFNNAEAKARFASGPTTDIARVGLGVAVRSGAARPRRVEASSTCSPIYRYDTGECGGCPGAASLRATRDQRGAESQDKSAVSASTGHSGGRQRSGRAWSFPP